MDTNRDSAHQSQNDDNFSLGLEFLNEAEKEKNNRKGDLVSAPSRLASPSDGKMQQILTETIPPALLWNNWFILLAVYYRVMEHLGSLENTQEAP